MTQAFELTAANVHVPSEWPEWMTTALVMGLVMLSNVSETEPGHLIIDPYGRNIRASVGDALINEDGRLHLTRLH